MSDEAVQQPLESDLPAGTVVGDYAVECKLGDGGMATVYGAVHPLIGKKAAIKVMNPTLSVDAGLVERFVLEARAVNAIGHPNIVDVFSFGRLPDGRSYFVMEWLQGETLYDRIYERTIGVDGALDIMDQICDALEAAHEKGIVHRDLKPANVFLSPVRGRRDVVKLLDFGVAKLMHPDLAGDLPLTPSTAHGHVVGTPDYISPEQARARKVNGKTDVYALGVIAYEMIFGRRPFEADNAADVVRMHLSETPPSPKSLWPEIPLPLDELLRAMLHKSADKRPSPGEVRAVIRELRGTPPPIDWQGAPPSQPRVAPPGTPTPSVAPLPTPSSLARRRLWMRAGGLALIGLGAAMLTAFFWKPRPVSQVATAPSPPTTAPSPPTAPPSPPTTPPSLPPTPPAAPATVEAPPTAPVAPAAATSQRRRRHRPAARPAATSSTATRGPRHDPDYLVDPFGAKR